MKTIHYHQRETVTYCYADEEIPRQYWHDFKEWMFDNEYEALIIPGLKRLVYHSRHVREYMRMKGIPIEEIIEDETHIIREIARGRSKLEIMD